MAPIFYYPLDIVPRRDNRMFYNVREDQLSFFQSLPSLFPFRVNRIYIYIYILKGHRIPLTLRLASRIQRLRACAAVRGSFSSPSFCRVIKLLTIPKGVKTLKCDSFFFLFYINISRSRELLFASNFILNCKKKREREKEE